MTRGDAAGLGTAGISSIRAETWDSWYAADPAPWEIDKPQPVFVELAAAGLLSGRVLDVGCGTGENALLAAKHATQAMGIDISPRAIKQAEEKAQERGIDARFEVADALRLDRLDEIFDVVIDSGMFQSFDADQRSLYASSLANVLRTGGILYLSCVSDRQPGNEGPRRVSEVDIRATFTRGWAIEELREVMRERRPSPAFAWFATIRRVGLDQSAPMPADRLCPDHDLQSD
jgi:SAM-dependent methyltransferase